MSESPLIKRLYRRQLASEAKGYSESLNFYYLSSTNTFYFSSNILYSNISPLLKTLQYKFLYKDKPIKVPWELYSIVKITISSLEDGVQHCTFHTVNETFLIPGMYQEVASRYLLNFKNQKNTNNIWDAVEGYVLEKTGEPNIEKLIKLLKTKESGIRDHLSFLLAMLNDLSSPLKKKDAIKTIMMDPFQKTFFENIDWDVPDGITQISLVIHRKNIVGDFSIQQKKENLYEKFTVMLSPDTLVNNVVYRKQDLEEKDYQDDYIQLLL